MTAPSAVTVAAPAKVNLQLSVGPRRSDGFHELATVYQAVDVHDEVTLSAAPHTTLRVEGVGVEVVDVPTDGRNLALRAVAMLAEHAGVTDGHVAVHIRKRIPVAGGMAGGSADAAAALLAADTLWQLGTPRADLLRLAGRLGSDVPFALVGGTAAGIGRGERVEPLADAGSYWWLVLPSGGGLSTPEVYAELDRLRGNGGADPVLSEQLLTALAAGDPRRVAAALGNDLQEPALRLRPDLARVLRAAAQPPALTALVSGSGPTCLALAADPPEAEELSDRLRAAGHEVLLARGPVPGAHVVPAL